MQVPSVDSHPCRFQFGAEQPPAVRLSALFLQQAVKAPARVHSLFVRAMQRVDSIGPRFYELTKNDQNYLTDLGLRRSTEAQAFLAANAVKLLHGSDVSAEFAALAPHDHCVAVLAAQLGIKTSGGRFDVDSWARSAVSEELPWLCQIIDCYVNYLGSWEDAAVIARVGVDVASGLPNDTWSATFLCYCANILATEGDTRCRELYAQSELRRRDPYDRFFTRFRMAVAEVKRLEGGAHAASAIECAERYADRLRSEGLTTHDSEFARALVLNLGALLHVRAQRLDDAETAMAAAWTLMRENSNDTLAMASGVANRYRIQVLANRAVLAGLKNDWTGALAVYQDALRLANTEHQESYDEVLSLLGYALVRSGQPRHALAVLTSAEQLIAAGVTPIRLRQVWKLLAIASADVGDEVAANAWLARLNETN